MHIWNYVCDDRPFGSLHCRRRCILYFAGIRRRPGSLATKPNPPALGRVPPANLGFRLVAEPSQSVATSVVRNVTKLLRRT